MSHTLSNGFHDYSSSAGQDHLNHDCICSIPHLLKLYKMAQTLEEKDALYLRLIDSAEPDMLQDIINRYSEINDGGYSVFCKYLTIVGNRVTDYDEPRGGIRVVIPKYCNGMNILSFGTNALRGKRLISLTLPEGVEQLGSHATALQYVFADNHLTQITIPDSVFAIRGAAFENNPLVSVTIGGGVTIHTNANTMGINLGFRAYYLSQSSEAGTYEYISDEWEKTS